MEKQVDNNKERKDKKIKGLIQEVKKLTMSILKKQNGKEKIIRVLFPRMKGYESSNG